MWLRQQCDIAEAFATVVANIMYLGTNEMSKYYASAVAPVVYSGTPGLFSQGSALGHMIASAALSCLSLGLTTSVTQELFSTDFNQDISSQSVLHVDHLPCVHVFTFEKEN